MDIKDQNSNQDFTILPDPGNDHEALLILAKIIANIHIKNTKHCVTDMKEDKERDS